MCDIATVVGIDIEAVDRRTFAEISRIREEANRMKAGMKQSLDDLGSLRAELERAKRLRLSPHRIDEEAKLPVHLGTLYRWLGGEVEPKLRTFNATLAAIREFLDGEEERLKRGAKTRGGRIMLEEENYAVVRDAKRVPLKGQEFKLLEVLTSTPRPAYFDWICDVSGISLASLPRAASELRRKIECLDLNVKTIPGKGGEMSAYFLEDLFLQREEAS